VALSAVPRAAADGPDDDTLAAARALLPAWRLDAGERLRSGERSIVRRITGLSATGERADLVVKLFRTAGEGWVREVAALECLRGTGSAPHLVASGDAPPVMIADFAGHGASVADTLQAGDPEAAADAVRRWARALAGVHGASRELRPRFRDELRAREGDLPVAETRMAAVVEDAVRTLDQECAALGVAVPTGSFDALRGIGRRLAGSGAAALTPSDTCPDNNVLVDDRLVLLDFEGAEWRHVAWDVAYLRVPWPTCWCAWRLPPQVVEDAIAGYREEAAAALPEVADGTFLGDVAAASVAWSLMSTMWFLPSLRAGNPPPPPDRPAPPRLAVVAHRLAVAQGHAADGDCEPLGELAGRLAEAIAGTFGAGRLELAPAFREQVSRGPAQ